MSRTQAQPAANSSIKIPPYHYIHVLDKNSNVTRVELGPQTFIRQDHEQIQTGPNPQPMIVLAKRQYCQIENPVVLDQKGEPARDKYGQVLVRHGEVEIRFHEDYTKPFPLYPKEQLTRAPTPLQVVKEGQALKIEATRNFKRGEKEFVAGEQYLFKGPATYYPRVEEAIVEVVDSYTIGECQALQLRAKQELTDKYGKERKTGEEWLIREAGAYLPEVHEQVVQIVNPYIIDTKNAIHLRALQNFTDFYGIERKAGEEYLITLKQSSYHIKDIYEEQVSGVQLTILKSDQYCIILNPFDPETQKNRLGAKILVQGPKDFFLQPGEVLEGGIRDAYVMSEDEALLLKAKEKVRVVEVVAQGDKQVEVISEYEPGNKWMIYGPCSYIPPIEVEVVELRKKIALDKNEGIYVRDTKTGKVRSVSGEAYLLKSHEELWEMELPSNVEELLRSSYFHSGYKREKHKVVSFRAPFNTAVQVYDYKRKTSRIVFGPDLVTLEPDEVFTQSALSGSTPKKPGVIQTLAISLGPEFSTDEIQVETSDHAVLRLLLAYNWHFRVDKTDQVQAARIFNVKDFIGDMCNLMASKVRSAVAQTNFDDFHKNSARLIRKAIFGIDKDNKINREFMMEKNSLIITNVDIKQVEPVDQQTRMSLQKTVSLAIEISTKKQEAAAQHLANQMEQKAIGELDEIKIRHQLLAEQAQQALLQQQSKSKEVETQGVAKAVAEAEAKADQIRAESNLLVARLKAEAKKIESEAKLKIEIERQEMVIKHEQEVADIEINRSKELAAIEARKFQSMIDAIGQETLIAISNAGPETQAELLKGLGLQGYIFTDGNNPINLFNTAQGLIGQAQQQA